MVSFKKYLLEKADYVAIGQWQYKDKKGSVKDLLKFVEKYETVNYPLSKLKPRIKIELDDKDNATIKVNGKWVKYKEAPIEKQQEIEKAEEERTKSANLNYPIIIVTKDGIPDAIIDGNHRYKKAIQLNKPNILAKLIPQEDL
jgi:hypothetical protein